MNCKKIFIVFGFLAVFGFVFNFSPPVVKAQNLTVEDIRAQIADLLSRIAQLQQQLAQVKNKPTEWCWDFNRNIKWKDKGKEVGLLHTALEKEGFEISQDERTSGYFYTSTLEAAMGFQRKYKDDISEIVGYDIDVTGFVGKGTRTKLNELYGCGVVRPIPIPVPLGMTLSISPTNLVLGNTYTFTGTLTGAAPNSDVRVYIKKPDGTMQNTRLYVGTTDSNGYLSVITNQQIGGDQPGIYKVWVFSAQDDKESNVVALNVFSPAAACDDSDGGMNYYKIGTVTDEGKLYTDYCLNDLTLREYFCLPTASVTGLGGVAQEDYNCSAAAGCQSGACVKPAVSPSPAPSPSPVPTPSITVLSPNGGEKWIEGNTYDIAWNSGGIKKVNIGATSGGHDLGYISSGLDAALEKYSWKIPAGFTSDFGPSSNYSMKIAIYNADNINTYDVSDNHFSIVAPASTPSITILSPQPGDSLVAGSVVDIQWQGANITSGEYVLYYHIDGVEPYWNLIINGGNGVWINAATASYKWTVPNKTGKASIWVGNSVNGQWKVVKTVDDLNIVSPASITVLSPNGGEVWEIGKPYTITWKHNLAGNYEAWIDLLKGGKYFGSIAGDAVRIPNAQNITSYSWVVGDIKGGVGNGGIDFQVRVNYLDGNFPGGYIVSDTSDNYFSIIDTRKASPCGSYGDVNGDGYVTSVDSTLASDIWSGKYAATDEELSRADVNGNGQFVETQDVLAISDYVNGNAMTFSVCSTIR